MERTPDWTLINEFGDRIERILTGKPIGKSPTFSYWGIVNGKRVSGQLNKVKKAYNDFRGKKTKWETVFE